MPGAVEEALHIDQETNMSFWHDAIQKEMTLNNWMAFQFLDEEESVPPGYKWIKCHLIFDVKWTLHKKGRFDAGDR